MWFRYEKDGKDVVQDLNLEVKQGEFLCACRWKRNGEKYDLIADQSCPCSLQGQDFPEWD